MCRYVVGKRRGDEIGWLTTHDAATTCHGDRRNIRRRSVVDGDGELIDSVGTAAWNLERLQVLERAGC
jgi:hypothetical protein